jgi:aminoglycoside phosphotransferase (APT) family kinase protein
MAVALDAERFLGYLRAAIGNTTYAQAPKRLQGGYYASVYAFALDCAPPEWSGQLVLRVFPHDAEAWLVRREAVAQRVVYAAGLPAPRVLVVEEDLAAIDRMFIVMERLPGRALLGGAGFPSVVLELPKILRSMPHITAETHARLHGLDPAPLLAGFEGAGISAHEAGIDRWFDELDRGLAEWSLDVLRPAVDWLKAHRPPDSTQRSICHGDLGPSNILVEGETVTGILDWSLVTIADPAFDVGGMFAAFGMAPGFPGFVQRIATRVGGTLARRFHDAYRSLRSVDEDAVRYFSAMRALTELGFVVRDRARVAATGVPSDVRPIWRPDQLIEYFRTVTGVAITL